MTTRPSEPAPCSHEDLVLHVLGRLDPRRREEVVAALARDPALAREAAGVAEHLGLYDALPAAGEPPPFAALLPRLGPQQASAAGAARRRWIPWAAAAGLLLAVGAAVGVWARRGSDELGSARWGRPGPGLAVTLAADGLVSDGTPSLSAPDGPAEAQVGERVRVVLDRGARLLPVSAEEVRLEAGRAWFEVAPGPFRVRTAFGDVEVLGTAFEVSIVAGLSERLGLSVRVLEGRVRVSGREFGPGQGLADGSPVIPAGTPGSFARRPALAVVPPAAAAVGTEIEARLVFEAPRFLRVSVPGPAPVASAAWLAFERPDGSTATVGLDLANAGPGAPLPGHSLTLEAGERREIVFRVPLPPGLPGTWRLSALYRPEGEAALASPIVPLEVR